VYCSISLIDMCWSPLVEWPMWTAFFKSRCSQDGRPRPSRNSKGVSFSFYRAKKPAPEARQ
jgi:hypothetical protein